MAHEILLVKLYEMNKEFAKLHSRIELTGTSDLEQIKTEIKVLHKECQENRLILQNQLKFSRAPKVRQISVAYDRIEAIIKEAQKDLFEKSWSEEMTEEEMALLAEYSLDFAMQAANNALLVSMEAIRLQMEDSVSKENKNAKEKKE